MKNVTELRNVKNFLEANTDGLFDEYLEKIGGEIDFVKELIEDIDLEDDIIQQLQETEQINCLPVVEIRNDITGIICHFGENTANIKFKLFLDSFTKLRF